MNIEITKEDFEKLIELLYIADWVMTSHTVGEQDRWQQYAQVIQKMFAKAVQTGMTDKLAYDPDLEKYVPTSALDHASDARAAIDSYDDETFWHELLIRFTDRDLERQIGGPEKLRTLRPEERFDLEIPIEDHYSEEFSEHGIERLEIVERFTPETGIKTSD